MIKVCLVAVLVFMLGSQLVKAQTSWNRFSNANALNVLYQEKSPSPATVSVTLQAALGNISLLIAQTPYINFEGTISTFCEEWVFLGILNNSLLFDVKFGLRILSSRDVHYDSANNGLKKLSESEEYARANLGICLNGNKDESRSLNYTFYVPIDSSNYVRNIVPRSLKGRTSIDMILDRTDSC